MQFREIDNNKIQCLANVYDSEIGRGRQKLIYTFRIDDSTRAPKLEDLNDFGNEEQRDKWLTEISEEIEKYKEIAMVRRVEEGMRKLDWAVDAFKYGDFGSVNGDKPTPLQRAFDAQEINWLGLQQLTEALQELCEKHKYRIEEARASIRSSSSTMA